MKYLVILFTIIFSYTLSFAANVEEKNETGLSTTVAVDRFYVGSDRACDYNTIQAAINAASKSVNPPEVLVADNKSYDENVFINTDNILIDGSYANCSNARNGIHGGNRAKVRGYPASAIATLQITGLFVSIKGLQLDTNSGGGINAQERSVITLENMLFYQLGDSAITVGGSGQVDVKIKNSTFLLNSSFNGGAIDCSGPTHSIEVTHGSGFANNTASNTGGAVWVGNGCEFSMTDGSFQNNSGGSGGGIHATSGAKVDLNRVVFDGNKAISQGGAISVYNTSTIVNAEATHFLRNESDVLGGAVAVLTGKFTLKRSNKSCFDLDKCNLFDGNTALRYGGAIHGANSSHIDISSTYFENNRANAGTAYYAEGSSSSHKIEGSVFIQNGNHAAGGYDDRNVIRAYDRAVITISYSTFADNNALFATFSLGWDSHMYVRSSIIYDSSSGDVFDTSDDSSHTVDCLLVHESSSFDANNAKVTVADPMFIDPTNQNYHIDAALSPAVDYCSDAVAMAEHEDIDFQVRGFDNQQIVNKFGPYDIGADESLGNKIFGDGFE